MSSMSSFRILQILLQHAVLLAKGFAVKAKAFVIAGPNLGQFLIDEVSPLLRTVFDDAKIFRRKNHHHQIVQQLCGFADDLAVFFNHLFAGTVQNYGNAFIHILAHQVHRHAGPRLIQHNHVGGILGAERSGEGAEIDAFDEVGFSLSILPNKNISRAVKRQL